MGDNQTLLQFGSAVAATQNRKGRQSGMSTSFKLLFGFHVLYSKTLLRATQWRLTAL